MLLTASLWLDPVGIAIFKHVLIADTDDTIDIVRLAGLSLSIGIDFSHPCTVAKMPLIFKGFTCVPSFSW